MSALFNLAIYSVALSQSLAILIAAISAWVENLFGGVRGDLRVMFGEPPITLPDLTTIAPTLNLLLDVEAILAVAAIKEASLFEINSDST